MSKLKIIIYNELRDLVIYIGILLPISFMEAVVFLGKEPNQYYYVYYKKKDGKRTKVSTKTKLKSEAQKYLLKFNREFKIDLERDFTPVRLKEYSWKFLKYSQSVHSYHTSRDYRITFKFLINYLGDPYLNELTATSINEYLEHRIKTVSLHVARRDLINIKSFLNKAVRDNYLLENPSKNIKRIKVPEKQPLFFRPEEFNELLKNISNLNLRDMVIFAVNTGLRQMELISLEWNQIDLNDRFLILDNRNHITKSRKIRTIPLNESAVEVLSRRLNGASDKYVFTFEGKQFKQDYVVHSFKKYVRKSNINHSLNFHSLRHTFASWLAQKGISIYQISKLLGHADIRTTEIYAHLRPDDLRQSVEMLCI